MSKSQAKNQNKGRNPGESSNNMGPRGDLDANQSTSSMSSGTDDTTVNQTQSGDASGSYDEEGTHHAFGEPEQLESYSDSQTVRPDSQSSEEGTLLSRAASALDSQSVKKNLNLVKNKAQDLLQTGKEQLSSRYSSLSDDVKLRGMMVNDNVKANPYAWALGAVGVGFVLGRVISGKGKQDLEFVKSAVNKFDVASLASLVGVSLGGKESESASSSSSSKAKAGYNKRQARKIG